MTNNLFNIKGMAIHCTTNELAPHITIATFNGGTPTDANSIKGWSELIQPIIIPVTLRKI